MRKRKKPYPGNYKVIHIEAAEPYAIIQLKEGRVKLFKTVCGLEPKGNEDKAPRGRENDCGNCLRIWKAQQKSKNRKRIIERIK